MADVSATLEALENSLMRAWVGRDHKQLRKLLSLRFRMVVGGTSPVLLDRKSLSEAAAKRWTVSAYRFGTSVYAREVDGVGIFAADLEMECTIDGRDISGRWWMSDLWRKSTMLRRWQLIDRQLARLDDEASLATAVRALQLWR